MKAIKLTDKLILREWRREFNRDEDHMMIGFAIDPIFGTTYTNDERKEQRRFDIMFSKENYPDAWDAVKDSSNKGVIVWFQSMMVTMKDLTIKYRAYEENPIQIGTEILSDNNNPQEIPLYEKNPYEDDLWKFYKNEKQTLYPGVYMQDLISEAIEKEWSFDEVIDI